MFVKTPNMLESVPQRTLRSEEKLQFCSDLLRATLSLIFLVCPPKLCNTAFATEHKMSPKVNFLRIV